LKRHSRTEDSVPETIAVPVLATQLSLPFAGSGLAVNGATGATERGLESGAPEVHSQSRREFRPEEAPRQARLLRTPEQDRDHVAMSLGLYLPPGKTLELSLTNNHYSMISVRRKRDGYRLRLHRMFVGAEPRIVRALARYVVHNDRRASRMLGEFIEKHQHIIRQQERRPRLLRVRTVGKHHDLQVIFDRLNGQLFEGKLEARITWGPAGGRDRRRRSIKMGSFAVEDRVIRIHPALDQDHVPDFFVSWIVFHEMLHGKHEVLRENGRRRFHTPEFLAEERTFPDYDRACAWEKANLDRLLRS
jgi:predicted metal-dependent hydrolase